MLFLKEAYYNDNILNFLEMIKEARSRKVKTNDIFEIPSNANLWDPAQFIYFWYRENGIRFDKQQYFKLRKVVLDGIRAHRETLEGYLDSITNTKNYKKIPPASISQNGRVDGKHRALLAFYLGIEVPVIKEN